MQRSLVNDGTGFDSKERSKDQELPDNIETYLSQNQEEDKLLVIRKLLERKGIETKTELNDNQIEAITKLMMTDEILNNRYGKKYFSKYYEYFMLLQLSRNRRSREEITNLFKNTSTIDEGLESLGNAKSLFQ